MSLGFPLVPLDSERVVHGRMSLSLPSDSHLFQHNLTDVVCGDES